VPWFISALPVSGASGAATDCATVLRGSMRCRRLYEMKITNRKIYF